MIESFHLTPKQEKNIISSNTGLQSVQFIAFLPPKPIWPPVASLAIACGSRFSQILGVSFMSQSPAS